ncbi:hypothetical protein QWZ13_06715 [Reinekea marina]|uniref:hypothetical protein n=1 Tax=Reinekea marina TaxID=1310421 RepID=UPI0025B3630A|nr:hypothetical protein [Reinekea marina]MDN3648602.1 hypothetical protein [Reinekea marina]
MTLPEARSPQPKTQKSISASVAGFTSAGRFSCIHAPLNLAIHGSDSRSSKATHQG